MPRDENSIVILLADDDSDDRLMAARAFRENRLANELRFVTDGEELMEYLHRRGPYAHPATSPRPGLILLDLNMPRKDGREALKEIKGDRSLRTIPVIVLTTSSADEDIVRAYDLGVNSFISKPVSFGELVRVVGTLGSYWLEVVHLPVDAHEQAA